MKFATFLYKEQESIGLVNQQEKTILDLVKASKEKLPNNLVECLKLEEDFMTYISNLLEKEDVTEYTYLLEDVMILAPVQKPPKNVICIGKNYAEHAIEMGSAADIPEHPIIFTKPASSIIKHEATIDLHEEITNSLDYEGELAVVIGKKGKNISKEEAEDYIFGYTIINDITARDLQKRHKQFFIGKSLDTSCPMGPYVVHKSELPLPLKLNIETKINGEVRQSSNSSKMIFDIPTIIAVISQGMTLEPGDVIATGTPAGVGKGFQPPRFLQHGDEIEITIEGIGMLRNKVVK